jgi:hypothetical protein
MPAAVSPWAACAQPRKMPLLASQNDKLFR